MDPFSDPAYHVATSMLIPAEMGVENAWKQVGVPPLCIHHLHLGLYKANTKTPFKAKRGPKVLKQLFENPATKHMLLQFLCCHNHITLVS